MICTGLLMECRICTAFPFKMLVSGFKYTEIAEKLNLPIGTVKSRIFLARKRLQAVLADYK